MEMQNEVLDGSAVGAGGEKKIVVGEATDVRKSSGGGLSVCV